MLNKLRQIFRLKSGTPFSACTGLLCSMKFYGGKGWELGLGFFFVCGHVTARVTNTGGKLIAFRLVCWRENEVQENSKVGRGRGG